MDPVSTAMSNSDRLLRRFLRANMLFSGLCGLVFATPTRTLPALTGRPSSELINLGLSLLAFAVFVGWLSFRRPLERRWTKGLVALIVGLDVLWVIQTAVHIAGLASYTRVGRWLFAGLALVVLGLAAGQGYALRRLHHRSSTTVKAEESA